MEAPQVLLVVLVVAVFALLAYAGWRAQQQRKKDLAALAARLGLRWSEKDSVGVASRLEAWFDDLRTGNNRYAYNVLSGRLGERDAYLFDHHYETYSTNSKGHRQTHHHHRSFVALRHDVDLGQVDLRPEGLFDKLKAAFGFDDIDFESSEFSSRFHVKASDRKLAYDIFHPPMIEYLLPLGDLRLTTAAGFLLARRGGVLKPPALEKTLHDALGFLDRLPRYLRRDRGGDA